MTRTPVLYLMVGGIASGKTTIGRLLSLGSRLADPEIYTSIPIFTTICPDDIREELSGNAADQSVNADAWAIAYVRLEAAMETKNDVIFDAAYMVKQKTRRIMNGYAKKYGYRIVYIVIPVDLNDALAANANRKRRVPEDVVRRYHDNFKQAFPFVENDRK